MDPVATLQRLMDAIDDGDWDEAEAALSNLREWRERGGTTPRFPQWFKAVDCD